MKTYNSGVYSIKNKITGALYVGSSLNISRRFYDHVRDLNLNKHHSRYLQRSWNKHSESNFVFDIMLYCDPDKKSLEFYEQIALDYYQPEYNICKIAYSTAGRKLSNEHISKMSQAVKGAKNPFYGKKHSQKTRIKMSTSRTSVRGSRNPRALIDEQQARKIKYHLLYTSDTSAKIAKKFHTTIHVVNNIKCGKTWKHA